MAGGKGPPLPSPSLAPGWGAFILLGQPFVSRSQRVRQTLASFLSLKGWARPFHSKQWWFWEVPFLSGCWGGVERQTTVALMHRDGALSLQWEISYWLFQPSREAHYSLSPTLSDCLPPCCLKHQIKDSFRRRIHFGPLSLVPDWFSSVPDTLIFLLSVQFYSNILKYFYVNFINHKNPLPLLSEDYNSVYC